MRLVTLALFIATNTLGSTHIYASAADKINKCSQLIAKQRISVLEQEQQLQELIALKYDPSVARRMLLHRPDVAEAILKKSIPEPTNFSTFDMLRGYSGVKMRKNMPVFLLTEPLDAFRGLTIPLVDFNPNIDLSSAESRNWFVNHTGLQWFAGSEDQPLHTYIGSDGTLIQYQIPGYLGYWKREIEEEYWDMHVAENEGAFWREEFNKNDLVFTRRIGRVSLIDTPDILNGASSWRSEDGKLVIITKNNIDSAFQIEWFDFDDLFDEMGKPLFNGPPASLPGAYKPYYKN
jgi:hypothetical protein